MKLHLALLLAFLALPLGAQAWDLRVEVPYPTGQNLPQTFLSGTGDLVHGTLNTGTGSIVTLSSRIIRVGPILKLEWLGEVAQWQANGQIQTTNSGQGTSTTQGSNLTQKGVGVGLNAQLWIPFTGFAAEVGVIERFNAYQYSGSSGGISASQSQNLTQSWMRVGARFEIAIPGITPYLCASYQQPITSSSPLQVSSTQDLKTLFSAQGAGQQFNRVWTFGVGIMF